MRLRDMKEALKRHEGLCYEMMAALRRDPEDVRDAAVRVLDSRDALLAAMVEES